ncbi:MAG: M15 family metallopeptidase, partial [Bacilli bacterium]
LIKINSIEYKLEKKGYNVKEINEIIKFEDKAKKDYILNNKYNEVLPIIFKEKYFKFNNIDLYLKYYAKNKTPSFLISYVNTQIYDDYYESTKTSDITKGFSVLVNRYNYLPVDYVPENIVKVDASYAYDGVYISNSIYPMFKEMMDAAKENNFTLIAFSGYRSGKDQEKIYNQMKSDYGERKADSLAARPGFSEHQTGYVIEVGAYNKEFDKTKEQQWLLNNSYKYGFILRYPKDKEKFTGFKHEPCHLRYVGKDVALKIHEENISFDEYYAYYEGK